MGDIMNNGLKNTLRWRRAYISTLVIQIGKDLLSRFGIPMVSLGGVDEATPDEIKRY